MKKIIILLTICLMLLGGCAEAVTGTDETQPAATSEIQPAYTSGNVSEGISPEEIVNAGTAANEKVPPGTLVNQDGVPIEEPIEEEDTGTVLRYEPPVKEVKEPLFVSGELDLSQSTPEEIVIKIIYYDQDGNTCRFKKSGGDSWVYVSIYEGDTYLIKNGSFNHCDFDVKSSEDQLVITKTDILPTESENVTIKVSIDIGMWNACFGKETLSSDKLYSSLTAVIPVTW